jgi:hypothetical protein
MYQLVRTTILQNILYAVDMQGPGNVPTILNSRIEELRAQMEEKPPLLEGYVFARIFNTATHQVLVQRTFEEEVDQDAEFDPAKPFESVQFKRIYQLSLTLHHNGVKVEQKYSFEEEAFREKAWLNLNQADVDEWVPKVVAALDEPEATATSPDNGTD